MNLRRTLVSIVTIMALASIVPGGVACARASCGAESCPLDNSAFGARGRRWSFEVSYQFVDQDRVRVGIEPGSLAEAYAHGGEVRTVSHVTTTKAYLSLSPALLVSASLQMIDRMHRHVTVDEIEGISELREWQYSGAGDLTLLGNAILFRGRSLTAPWSFAVQGGTKLPTGRTHVPEIDGEQPEPHARPGTGSTDWLAGLQMIQTLPIGREDGNGVVLFGSALYTFTGRGTEGYRMGRVFDARAGASVPVVSWLRALAQVSTLVRGQDRSEGVLPTDPHGHEGALRAQHDDESGAGGTRIHENTGGTDVFVSPGLRVELSPLFAISGYAQIPVYHRVNGTQLESPTQIWVGTTFKLP